MGPTISSSGHFPNLKCIAGMNILGSGQNFCLGFLVCRVKDIVVGKGS